MNYHRGEHRAIVTQIFEGLFFSVSIGAFILVIPMKSKLSESQLESRTKSAYLTAQRIQTGEREIESERLTQSRWNQVFEWSEQLSTETDQGPGEKE